MVGPTVEEISILEGIIKKVVDDLELSDNNKNGYPNKLEDEKKAGTLDVRTKKNKIFIVHGHNDLMKQSIARIIEKLDLEPIILHEQPNLGQTIIEKFHSHSDVGFAIVLLSADDIGYSKKDGEKNSKNRARQNVIFELGFFTAKLGRNCVVAIVENIQNFELPSDISGVIYINYDGPDGKWKYELAKEISKIGYEININKIL